MVKVEEEMDQFIILKRVGEHYNLIFKEGEEEGRQGVFSREDLSKDTLKFWGFNVKD